MQGEKQVAALLRAKVTPEDSMSIKLSVGLKTAYMVLSEFENELGYIACKVFPKESAAKAYAQDQEIIEVQVVRQFK